MISPNFPSIIKMTDQSLDGGAWRQRRPSNWHPIGHKTNANVGHNIAQENGLGGTRIALGNVKMYSNGAFILKAFKGWKGFKTEALKIGGMPIQISRLIGIIK